MNRTPENGMDAASAVRIRWFSPRQALVDQLFADSGAQSRGLQRDVFAAAREQGARKRFGEESPGVVQLEEYLSTLHLQDLALACACAEGRSDAWDYFVSTFRGYLRSAAAAILRCPPQSPAACELADSLFADLYGLGEGANRRSLFRYFHGRSSLKTWLRAVLAQRHIDAIRVSRRFASLDDAEAGREKIKPRQGLSLESPADPHRERYMVMFRCALDAALARLDPRDSERLRLYYA